MRDWEDDPRNPSRDSRVVDAAGLPRPPKGGTPHSPHNFYCNVLLDTVSLGDGWIMFLDDDDMFNNDNALSEIVSHVVDEDTMIYWQMKFADGRLAPDTWNGTPRLGYIGSPCFLFHSKWKDHSWWDDWKCSDFRFVERLHKKIPNHVYIEKPFIQIGGIGMGKRKDVQP